MIIEELVETVAPLEIKAEGNCDWDRKIYCCQCGCDQVYWGIECYEGYERGEFPASIVHADMFFENKGDDDTAARICFWYFGWRAVDGKMYCPACVGKMPNPTMPDIF